MHYSSLLFVTLAHCAYVYVSRRRFISREAIVPREPITPAAPRPAATAAHAGTLPPTGDRLPTPVTGPAAPPAAPPPARVPAAPPSTPTEEGPGAPPIVVVSGTPPTSGGRVVWQGPNATFGSPPLAIELTLIQTISSPVRHVGAFTGDAASRDGASRRIRARVQA